MLGTGGCGSDAAGAEPSSPPASASAAADAPSPDPSPSPTVDKAALQDKAKAAAIGETQMKPIGVSVAPRTQEAGDFGLAPVCGQRLAVDAEAHGSYRRVWSDQGWWIQNTVVAYTDSSGLSAVSQAKGAMEACKTYPADDEENTVLGPVQLPSYPGIDSSYAYCLNTKRQSTTYINCVAFLAKGNIVSTVWVIHGGTQKTNSAGVIGVGSVAAEALTKSAAQ
ncbi:hypothetical protein [Dactylosporangium sp. NPDC048998]|uniref:hypothetical protein n=1 Tax=Dactylosporangium sp. NPDC048998 TaxID=3363976 RepID=UPI003714A716